MATLDKAILIAVQAHQNQKDRNGKHYILHPIRVMMRFELEAERTVAILHDVVEKTDWTIERLRDQGFGEDIIEAVDLLTRRDSQPYMEYINKLKGNDIARKVKIADIEDNMDPTRMENMSEKNTEKLSRLHKAWHILKNRKNNFTF